MRRVSDVLNGCVNFSRNLMRGGIPIFMTNQKVKRNLSLPDSFSNFFWAAFLPVLFVFLTGCASPQPGPFAYPDGIYEGASDYYE